MEKKYWREYNRYLNGGRKKKKKKRRRGREGGVVGTFGEKIEDRDIVRRGMY